MKKAALEEVQASLAEFVKTSAKHPVLIVRDGEPVALLVGISRNGKRSPTKLREVLKRAWEDYEHRGGIGHKRFWDELAKETA